MRNEEKTIRILELFPMGVTAGAVFLTMVSWEKTSFNFDILLFEGHDFFLNDDRK